MSRAALLNMGWRPVRTGVLPGAPCRVLVTGRRPRYAIPDEQAQRVWRCASVREVRERVNPWRVLLPGTERMLAGVVEEVRSRPSEEVEVRHASGRVRRYPWARVFVPLRVRLSDVGEDSRWSSVVVGPEENGRWSSHEKGSEHVE